MKKSIKELAIKLKIIRKKPISKKEIDNFNKIVEKD